MTYYDQVTEAAAFLKARLGTLAPHIGIVLGSGSVPNLQYNDVWGNSGGNYVDSGTLAINSGGVVTDSGTLAVGGGAYNGILTDSGTLTVNTGASLSVGNLTSGGAVTVSPRIFLAQGVPALAGFALTWLSRG